MIEEEQKELADYIKGVHLSLRRKSQQIGAELAWKEHVENEEVLRNYAACMKNLAEKYWAANNKKEKDKYLCRIQWIIDVIREFFTGEEMVKEFFKEKRKMENFVSKSLIEDKELEIYDGSLIKNFGSPFKVLDVGSCYNPFGSFDFLETFPIDLYPAISSVKKCDFTKICTEDDVSENWFHDNMKIIPKNYFDIVIFSLFLEYLPCSKQRYFACVRAYEALKFNGLLLIATPDSKHESANAKFMKAWKLKLAQIGFVRVKFEKLKYIYCMAFRKCISQKYPAILCNIRDSALEDIIEIPQDFVDYENKKINSVHYVKNEENLRETFAQLPFS